MGDKQKREKGRESALAPLGDFGFWRQGIPFGRLFDEFLNERGLLAARWKPAVDLGETDAAYAVTVELPGAKREDVTIEVHGDVLSIRGEKKSEREEKDERRHVIERSYGSFERSFTLPANADAERITATFKDGVLTVEIPKTAQTKPKQVDIKTA